MRGKVVLITGASSGIGAETAVWFASLGCRLAMTARNTLKLQETSKRCMESGSREEDLVLIPADLSIEDDIRKIIDQTIDKFGKLDILINNAGLMQGAGVTTTSLAEYDINFNVNTRAVFYLTQLAVPHLEATKGNIVNVSSVSSLRPVSLSVPYSMSKAALDHFTRMVAVELAPKQIRVNAVNPGFIETEHDEEYILEKWRKKHALGRVGRMEEVAKAIAFLADEQSSAFVTGVNFNIDGGLSLMGPS